MKEDAKDPYILKTIILEDINRDHRTQGRVFVNLGACCVPGSAIFINSNSIICHHNPMRKMLVLSPFYSEKAEVQRG